ncbi:MAG: DUF1330 domain-containing protein [Chloroflexi bacterium]|nr:DUF1330 domain-containing protein [Chloroflexota bacterium]
MKGYFVIDANIFDRELFAELAPKIADAMEAHGGRFVARGGAIEVTAGNWRPDRLVIMEFDSFEAAKGFAHSHEHHALDDQRARCMTSNTLVLEGFPDA